MESGLTEMSATVLFWVWWCVPGWGEWSVVADGVECELPQDLAGGEVDDADVEVADQESDVGPAWARPHHDGAG